MCFKTDRDQKLCLSSEIEPLEDENPSKFTNFAANSLCKLQWKIKEFEGFLSSRDSISELKHNFWSRSVLKHISYVYTIDSACFWTSGTHEIEVAEFFIPNPPSPLHSSSNRLQISFSDFRLRYGAAPNIPRAPSVRIPSDFLSSRATYLYFRFLNSVWGCCDNDPHGIQVCARPPT